MRYYGWYSNKTRARRVKQTDEEAQAEGDAVEVIDVSAHAPRRIPSKKWRELIKKVWGPTPCGARSAQGKCHSAPMETHAYGFRLRANAPEGQKRFPISHFDRLGIILLEVEDPSFESCKSALKITVSDGQASRLMIGGILSEDKYCAYL